MTNRHPFQPVRASFEALAARGLVAAGLRLRLSRELAADLGAAHFALLPGPAGQLLSLSSVIR
jgi:hypothetical protein